MAAVASGRCVGVRCRLCLMLTGQWTGLCGKAPSRFYSGSATLPKIEGANVTGIEEVVIPKKKTCDLKK
uniref:Pentatricopeptide repeat domain 3 n=1 Tax=Lynx canadensis TaxID=61383 RepID=A0A667HPE4_LYNCA